MSLQVWLPLTKDLRQQGLANTTITNNGATYSSTGGKLGGCYNFNGSSYMIGESISSNMKSASCWIKLTSNSTSQVVFADYKSHLAFGIFSTYIVCSCVDTSLKTCYSASIIPANTWVHIVVVKNTLNFDLYINGVLQEPISTKDTWSSNMSDKLSIGSRSNGSTCMNGAINDFRLYDHALSELEIKELSKGLVLHYPLNRRGFGQENLITQAMIDVEPWKSAISGSYTVDGKTGWILSNSQLYSKSGNGVNNIFSGLTYEENTQYTISFKWRDDYRTDGKSSSLYIRFKYSDGTTSQVILPKIDYWKEEVMTSTAGKTVSAITTTYGNGGNLLFTDLKLEKGTIKTSTSPIVNSNLYNSMGLNSTTEYDCSGYCNNGTRIGTFNWVCDIPKYSVSTVFPSGANYIDADRGAMVTDSITVSLWTKYSTWGNPISCTEGGGWNFENVSSSIRFPVYVASVGYKLAESNIAPSTLVNEWHMITGTFDRTNVKIYIDGELKGTTATGSTNGIAYAGSNAILIGAEASGSHAPASTAFVGNISDVRIYATALSSEDILDLYKQGHHE